MPALLIELQFLPPLQFFSLLQRHSLLILEDRKNFTKQTYRNRAHILGANGIHQLIVPVEKGKTQKLYKDVELAYAEDWPRQHWHSIKSAYGSAPYFEHYVWRIEKILLTPHQKLWDLNLLLLSECLHMLKHDSEVLLASEAPADVLNSAANWVDKLSAKTRSTASDPIFRPRPYLQVFSDRTGFQSNLSIIDLLFNQGPQAWEFL